MNEGSPISSRNSKFAISTNKNCILPPSSVQYNTSTNMLSNDGNHEQINSY